MVDSAALRAVAPRGVGVRVPPWVQIENLEDYDKIKIMVDKDPIQRGNPNPDISLNRVVGTASEIYHIPGLPEWGMPPESGVRFYNMHEDGTVSQTSYPNEPRYPDTGPSIKLSEEQLRSLDFDWKRHIVIHKPEEKE